jgi:hypothetical protein
MSQNLYRIRLFWDGRAGCAKYDGKERKLALPPKLTVSMTTVDFAPEVFTGLIQTYAWSAVREMTPEETEACMEYLRRMP